MFNSLSRKLIFTIVAIALASMMVSALVIRQQAADNVEEFVDALREEFDSNNRRPPKNSDKQPNPFSARFARGTLAREFEDDLSRGILTGAFSGVVLATIAAVILSRRITKPLEQLTAATHKLAQGNFGHQVKVNTDDEIGDLAAAFNKMSTDLARANQLRQQMTADIAHDLRTPLTVIAGYTEALSDGKFEGDPAIYHVMHEQVTHLQHLITDLRTLSLADAGELKLTTQKVPPRMLLERTAVAYVQQADEKGVQLRVDAAENLPFITVDVERMVQVLNNLVSNALRFTPEGGTIRLTADVNNTNMLLTVEDTGIGISPAELPNIFERTYRTDGSRQRSSGESGLGLAIVKSIVEAHGGQVGVVSAVGKGSTFTIQLPLL